MNISIKDIYIALQYMKTKYTHDVAFYQTAKQFGMSPQELNKLFQRSKAVKAKRKEIIIEEQLKMF